MNPSLIAMTIFSTLALIGFALSGLMIWRDLRKQHKPHTESISPYWRQIYKACDRAYERSGK